eukprot:jgi/Mesvir1/10670/Mv13762-RA.1
MSSDDEGEDVPLLGDLDGGSDDDDLRVEDELGPSAALPPRPRRSLQQRESAFDLNVRMNVGRPITSHVAAAGPSSRENFTRNVRPRTASHDDDDLFRSGLDDWSLGGLGPAELPSRPASRSVRTDLPVRMTRFDPGHANDVPTQTAAGGAGGSSQGTQLPSWTVGLPPILRRRQREADASASGGGVPPEPLRCIGPNMSATRTPGYAEYIAEHGAIPQHPILITDSDPETLSEDDLDGPLADDLLLTRPSGGPRSDEATRGAGLTSLDLPPRGPSFGIIPPYYPRGGRTPPWESGLNLRTRTLEYSRALDIGGAPGRGGGNNRVDNGTSMVTRGGLRWVPARDESRLLDRGGAFDLLRRVRDGASAGPRVASSDPPNATPGGAGRVSLPWLPRPLQSMYEMPLPPRRTGGSNNAAATPAAPSDAAGRAGGPGASSGDALSLLPGSLSFWRPWSGGGASLLDHRPAGADGVGASGGASPGSLGGVGGSGTGWAGARASAADVGFQLEGIVSAVSRVRRAVAGIGSLVGLDRGVLVLDADGVDLGGGDTGGPQEGGRASTRRYDLGRWTAGVGGGMGDGAGGVSGGNSSTRDVTGVGAAEGETGGGDGAGGRTMVGAFLDALMADLARGTGGGNEHAGGEGSSSHAGGEGLSSSPPGVGGATPVGRENDGGAGQADGTPTISVGLVGAVPAGEVAAGGASAGPRGDAIMDVPEVPSEAVAGGGPGGPCPGVGPGLPGVARVAVRQDRDASGTLSNEHELSPRGGDAEADASTAAPGGDILTAVTPMGGASNAALGRAGSDRGSGAGTSTAQGAQGGGVDLGTYMVAPGGATVASGSGDVAASNAREAGERDRPDQDAAHGHADKRQRTG